MIDGFKSIKEVAEEWEITPRRVRAMCAAGKIAGAEKVGRDWVVPAETERPKDGRITTGEYKNWRKSKEENK